MKHFLLVISMFSLAFVMIIPVSATGGLYEDSSGGVVLPSDSLRPIEPTVPVEPVPGSSNFLNNIGVFFVQSIAWLGAVLNVILQSPVLLIFVVGFVIVGVIIGYLRRSKDV